MNECKQESTKMSEYNWNQCKPMPLFGTAPLQELEELDWYHQCQYYLVVYTNGFGTW